MLKTLPDTMGRRQQELALQTTLGPVLIATKGYAAPEVDQAYARARELCQQMGDTPQLFPVLWGLCFFYLARAEYQTAQELAEQLLMLAQRLHTPALLLEAHLAQGVTCFWLGDLPSARAHFTQGLALYDPQQHRTHAFSYGQDPGMLCLSYMSWIQWLLGYPDAALMRSQEALILAQQQAHPFSLVYSPRLYRFPPSVPPRQTGHPGAGRGNYWARNRAGICIPKGIRHHRAWLGAHRPGPGGGGHASDTPRACRLSGHGGRSRLHILFGPAGRGVWPQASRRKMGLPCWPRRWQLVQKTGERFYEAELYRLQGELLLAQSTRQTAEAEACFHQALDMARRQQAKSLELRAAMSLSRLWQRLGKRTEARQLLVEIYGWFTEGFDTADLQEARALLAELA